MKKQLAFKFDWNQFLMGLFLGLFIFSLASCSSVPHQSIRFASTIGVSESKGTQKQDSITGRGMAVGIRGEIVHPSSSFENLELGLRLGLNGRDSQAEPESVQVEANSGEVSAVGVLRGLLPMTRKLSVYTEVFGGYAHNWGTVTGGPIDVNDNGGGLLFGAGAGLDFRNGLTVGLEWSRREFDIDPVEIRADDIVLVIGGVLRF